MVPLPLALCPNVVVVLIPVACASRSNASDTNSGASSECNCSGVRALISRGDSFFLEAPSFMSSWIDCKHSVFMSFSSPSVRGVTLTPDVDSIHLWKASVLLLWSCSLAEQVVKNTACGEFALLHYGWLMSHLWPSEVAIINFIFNRFFWTDSLMLVLPVLSTRSLTIMAVTLRKEYLSW